MAKELKKFDFVIGNPPYQDDGNNLKLYPFFYKNGIDIGNCVEMIFPTAWQEPKSKNNLGLMNNKETKEDKQIVSIENCQNVFPGVSGAEWTNIILWKKDYDNGLNGKQKIRINGEEKIEKLIYDKKDIEKPIEIINLFNSVNNADFTSIKKNISSSKPYGLRTDFLKNPSKYELPSLSDIKKDGYIKIYGNKMEKYAEPNYPFPKNKEQIKKFKVFIPSVWGNLSKNYLGGAYSDIIIGFPNEICTETFLESGSFDTLEEAQKHAKYLMTKFARALLFLKKSSIINTDAWESIPLQKYTEDWWNESIDAIDEHLFKKYNINAEICEFIRNNIQPKTENNIINFNGKND